MKKKSLGRQFALLFALIALISIIISGIVTYINQTRQYHNETITNLRQISDHLNGQITDSDDEFVYLKKWYSEHPDQVQIPVDFEADLDKSRQAFYDYANEHYDGRVPGAGLSYEEMDEEAMRLYGIYRFEYWFKEFFDTVDEFKLSYIYFVYPEENMDHTMNYMFDPSMATTKAPNGKEIIKLNDKVFEDPAIHKYMWEAWETGKAPESVDSLDNEFGYVYTYCYPLIINGEKIGVICLDTSVDRVNSEIASSVLRQVLISAAIFLLAIILLYTFLKKKLLDRIVALKQSVAKYSENKDVELADEIEEIKGEDDEMGALSDGFAGMIVELEDYMNNLQNVTAEKERIGAELNVATRIQADMLPSIFPAFPNNPYIDLYASMDPAKEVGGDFYDFFMIDDKHLALVIADVSGKGVPAALFMVIAKTLIKNQVAMGKSPAEALENVNNQLADGNESCLFVTVWLAVLDLTTGEVIEANAGHENPALCRKDGNFGLIKLRHSPAVAMMEDMKYKERTFHIDPGDTLFVYTDGVPEATNKDMEMFGEERLEIALNKYKDLEMQDLLPAIRREVDEFVGDADQFDDITMLGFRLKEGNSK